MARLIACHKEQFSAVFDLNHFATCQHALRGRLPRISDRTICCSCKASQLTIGLAFYSLHDVTLTCSGFESAPQAYQALVLLLFLYLFNASRAHFADDGRFLSPVVAHVVAAITALTVQLAAHYFCTPLNWATLASSANTRLTGVDKFIDTHLL